VDGASIEGEGEIMAKPLSEAIKEIKEHLQLNWDPNATDDDAFAEP
jgi:hypothetical protein